MPLVFGAMAKQGYGLLLRQVLEQTQGELLAVIFDPLVARVHPAWLEQFLLIAPAVFRPRYSATEDGIAQRFARPQVRHPNVEPVRRQTAPAPSCRQNPKAVARFDRAVN